MRHHARAIACVSLVVLLMSATSAFAYTPNDPGFSSQWYLSKLQMPHVWDETQPQQDIIVAVIDSGVDYTHPDLHDHIWVNQKEIAGDGLDNDHNGFVDDVRGWDFVNDDADPRPDYSAGCFADQTCSLVAVIHGTFVAGIIGAVRDNGQGIAGIADHVRIMPVRALGSDGSGNEQNVIEAIRYVVSNGAKIINLSFVGYVGNEELRAALNEAYQADVLVVAAAGNAGSEAPADLDSTKIFPVCFDALDARNIVLGVSATDEQDRLAGFSNYGASCIDITAPGKNFYGLGAHDAAVPELAQQYYSNFSGTSLAAPVVSGVAALVRAQSPRLPVDGVIRLISEASRTPVDLNLSDFSTKLARNVIDPLAIIQKLNATENPLGDALLIVPTGAKNGSVSVYDGAGKRLSGFEFSTARRPGVSIATYHSDILIAGADGTNSISTFITDSATPQLYAYRGVFTQLSPGTMPLVTVEQPVRGPLTITASPRGSVTTISGFTAGGMSAFSFPAFDTKYTKGVSLAAGFVDGDGEAEIVVGAGPGAGPQVRVFDATGKLQGQFFAFGQRERTGITVATGDVLGDSQEEIVVARQKGADATIRMFTSAGKRLAEFRAFSPSYTGGITLAVGNFSVDTGNELAVAQANGGAVRIFSAAGKLLSEFYPEGKTYRGGFVIARKQGQ